MNTRELAIRGEIFFTTGDPSRKKSSAHHFEDGVIVVTDGRVQQVLAYDDYSRSGLSSLPIREYPGCLICPGFIDAHVHYAQTRILASPAPGLLEWLENHTFPEEQRFASADYADSVAAEFFDELVRNGTTSALVFPTVRGVSVQKLFENAHSRNLRIASGKVLMNRNAPEELRDGPDCGLAESEALIRDWHGKGRQSYAIVLRFAGSSTRDQMRVCGKLVEKYPQLLFHTHLSETQAEISWVLGLYLEAADYLGIYESYGMVTDRSLFAHCIHLSDSECERMADAGAAAVLCPTSNTFIGSGLARPGRLADFDIGLSLGTDVGGGTSFSMLQTMREMYGVAKLGGQHLEGIQLFYMATLGGAKALCIDEHVGSFAVGMEADFVVMDAGRSENMRRRIERAADIEERLFVFAIMGAAENIRETWSMGNRVYSRDEVQLP